MSSVRYNFSFSYRGVNRLCRSDEEHPSSVLFVLPPGMFVFITTQKSVWSDDPPNHYQSQCPDDPIPTPPTVLRSTSITPQPVCSFVSYILMCIHLYILGVYRSHDTYVYPNTTVPVRTEHYRFCEKRDTHSRPWYVIQNINT